MMLVNENGILGSIGGGVLEHAVIKHAKEAGAISTSEFNLSNEESAALGMICGGENQILFIPLRKEI